MASHSCTNRAGTQPEQESLLVGMLAEIVARENDDATVDEGTEYCHAVRELAPETHSTRGFRNRPARDGHHVVGGHSDVQLHTKAIIEKVSGLFDNVQLNCWWDIWWVGVISPVSTCMFHAHTFSSIYMYAKERKKIVEGIRTKFIAIKKIGAAGKTETKQTTSENRLIASLMSLKFPGYGSRSYSCSQGCAVDLKFEDVGEVGSSGGASLEGMPIQCVCVCV
jgi:hypothetical protein